MSKRLVQELTYDASVTEVAQMLADPEFRQSVCDYQGCTGTEISIVPTGEGMDVTVDQTRPTAGVPGFAKKIVGDQTNIVQRETWTSQTAADLEITIPGKPGKMVGTVTLADVGGSTVETVDLTLTVNIPLVGGKIESLISDLLGKALHAENKVGMRYLSA